MPMKLAVPYGHFRFTNAEIFLTVPRFRKSKCSCRKQAAAVYREVKLVARV